MLRAAIDSGDVPSCCTAVVKLLKIVPNELSVPGWP